MFQQFQQGEEVFKIIFISGKVSCLGLKKKLTLASFFGSDKLKIEFSGLDLKQCVLYVLSIDFFLYTTIRSAVCRQATLIYDLIRIYNGT